MFRNLEAEQRRCGFTNEQMAEKLCVSRGTYETKKKTGRFTYSQIKALLTLFNCEFAYLFAEELTDKPA